AVERHLPRNARSGPARRRRRAHAAARDGAARHTAPASGTIRRAAPGGDTMNALFPPGFIDAMAAVLGLLFGSFLNVLIHRLPRNESPWSGRSHCPHCRRTVRWYENVPVVSWLLL